LFVVLARHVIAAEAPATASGIEFFESKVRPLLVEHCYRCHSASGKKPKGGLLLDSRDGLRKGGDSGRPVVVAGKPEESLLIQAVRYTRDELRMPPKGKLPDADVAALVEWVKRGAPDPRQGQPTPTAKKGIDIEAGRRFWAFQPPRRSPLPRANDPSWPRGPIDHFLLARLEAKGLRPARDADRYTLLRRITLDLTGLPPAPEEIEAFVNDRSPQAFEKVVDRLLASPAFGEHWARHWFDLSCYGDLGDVDGNIVQRDAWRYRDYVIQAFNQDKPFDRFIIEQIAGDLMPACSDEQRREQITATGFLAIGPWSLQNYIKPQMLADVVDHQIDKVGRVFLGMTLGCCRCHDHKFDPIPTSDYYALAGVFHSTLTTRHDGPGVWSRTVCTPLPESALEAASRKRAAAECEKTLAGLEAERKRLEQAQKQLDRQLAALQKADGGTESKRLQEERKSTEQALRDVQDRQRLVEYNRPQPPEALAVRDRNRPADCRVYLRGNFQTLGSTVPRGVLQAATLGTPPHIPAHASGRLELARWLVDDQNPLTARVLVNRFWHHLFGAGLVRTVDYFGTRGEPPSHPELLDYLALRFQEHGWSVKALLRELVLSRAYRMASDHNAAAMEIDPDNRLLWRMNRRRHEAEAIRDAILTVSGRLDRSRGGPSLGLDIPGNVNGLAGGPNPPTYSGKTIPAGVKNRRTVYLPLFRLRPAGELEILSVFDFPHPNEITGARAVTTVPTQALYLMNAPFLKEQARRTAERLQHEASNDEGRLTRLYLLALNRPPSAEETRLSLLFLDECTSSPTARPPSGANPRLEAWAQLCHAVFASNEFLFKE
jgi:hypothetical protein